MVCGESSAGALLKAMIELREKEGWEFKYDELLYCGPTFFQGALIENKIPQFIYHIEVQEFDEKIDSATGEPYKQRDVEPTEEGGEPTKTTEEGGRLMQNTYRVVLSLHEDPNIEVTGHYWQIIEFYKIGEVRLLA